MKTYIPTPEPVFEVKRFEPSAPIGWEQPVESESFLIRETQQYLIATDSLGLRWDVAWLKDGKRHQSFVLYTPHFDDEITEEERKGFRERARDLLRAEVPADGQQFRLKLPAAAWASAYV